MSLSRWYCCKYGVGPQIGMRVVLTFDLNISIILSGLFFTFSNLQVGKVLSQITYTCMVQCFKVVVWNNRL